MVVSGECCLEPPSLSYRALDRYWWPALWSHGSWWIGRRRCGGRIEHRHPQEQRSTVRGALKADKFLVLAHGTAGEVARARGILQTTHPLDIATHAAERDQPELVIAR